MDTTIFLVYQTKFFHIKRFFILAKYIHSRMKLSALFLQGVEMVKIVDSLMVEGLGLPMAGGTTVVVIKKMRFAQTLFPAMNKLATRVR